MKKLDVTAALSVIAACALVPAAAHAQDVASPAADEGQGEQSGDIIVTALKRAQSLQDVPASVTALSASDLAASGITNSFDLQQRVPGLAISYGNRETNVAIRGVSNNVRSVGADPSNAVHLNGVYLPQSSMVLTDLFDIQRVEVLKGPQGTLYGRNATGGAINVIARAPEEGFSAEGLVGYGSFDLVRGQLALNAGNDKISARIAGTYVDDNGYTANIFNGTRLDAQHFYAIRGQVRVQITPNLDVTFLAQVQRDNGSVGYGISTDPAYRAFPDNYYGLTVPASLQRTDPRHIQANAPVFSRRDSEIYAATVNWTVGNVGIKSITGFSNYDAADALDYDFTGEADEDFQSVTRTKSFSQEIQLFNRNKGRLDWTLGGYWYDDKGFQSINWHVPFPFANAESNGRGHARAVFGQATYHLSDKWSVLVGARYNHERKTGTEINLLASTSASVERSFDSFTPQGQIQFRPNRDVLIYAGVTRGFKSGGFNLLASGPPTVYQPEKITAYEAGIKSTWLDRRVTFDLSVFHYDYTDLQLRTLVFNGTGGGGGAFATINNADGAKITGVELNTSAKLGAGFTVDVAGTYLDGKFGNYISPSNNLDLTGTRLPLAPEWSGTAGLTYETRVVGGKLKARAEYNYRGRIVFPLTLDAPQNFDEAAGLFNASVRWTEPKDRFYVEVIGRNLGDVLYRVQRADVYFSGVYDSFGAPRTVEARVGFKF